MFTSPWQSPDQKLIVRLDASSLKRSNCAQDFYLSNLTGHRVSGCKNAPAFGTAIHKAAAALRAGTVSVAEANMLAMEYLIDANLPEDKLRTPELLLEILGEYLPQILPKADDFKVAHRNGKPAIELPFEIPFRAFDEVDFTLTGVFDELGSFDPQYPRFKDIKSTALQPAKVSGKWRTSSQMLLYSYVCKASGYSTRYPSPIVDMLFLRATRGKRFVRFKDEVLSEAHVDEYMSQVWDKAEEIYGWLKKDKFALNRTCCDTIFGDCQFRNVCDSAQAQRESMLRSMFSRKEYDPATFGEN